MDPKNVNGKENDLVSKSLEVTIKVGLVIALIIWCFMILKPFLMIMLWSIILAVAVYPLFSKLNTILRKRKKISAILITLLLILLILIPVILLGGSLGEAVAYIKDAVNAGKSLVPPPPESVRDWPVVGAPLYDLWYKASSNLATFAMQYKSQLVTGFTWFIGALTNAGIGILMFILSIIISGVLLVYSDKGGDAVRKIAIRLIGLKGEEMVSNSIITVRNVAKGILGVAFIQAFLAGLGFLVAGIPGAGLWALICFILAIVQIGIGPVVIGILIYAFMKLSLVTAILLTVWCAPLMIIDNILKPLLLGRHAPAPMLVVFLGAIGGFISFGTIGLFVGAVILSLGYDLFSTWLKSDSTQ